MSTTSIRLVLGDVEAEVVAEALDLYLRTRPPEADRRFEYRYRAARAVIDNLAQNRAGASRVGASDDTPERQRQRPDVPARRRERTSGSAAKGSVC